ncbi:MAG TPA: diguanylate cyclase [Anaeromyxobacteraceae bacterium]|nr:diguanylate cyclase [Anaeromyxobacteraceae bacterium]
MAAGERTGERWSEGNGASVPPSDGEPAPAPAESAPLLEANRRLRESAQHQDDLLALCAADLRSPTAALLMGLRRLRRAATGAEELALAALEEEARRVARVADGLGALRSLESGQVSVHPRPTELNGLVTQAVGARLERARACGVELTCELPDQPLTLAAEPDRLADLLGALLDGALAHSQSGEKVALRLEATPQGARLLVEDRRPSRPRAARMRRRAPARVGETGLGFALCRSLAGLHGGALEVRAHPDRHTVQVTLPLMAPAEAPEVARPAPRASKALVLVVDDDEDAREALAMMLADDYDVQLAADGQEAMESAQAARPDLVLMDLYMPRMDGLAALAALRGDPSTEDVPVILISARGDDFTRSRSLDLGAVDFLQKPFSGRELKARIERTLRLTRRETQLQALARTDPLTGLANIRAFRARLAEEVKRARRYHTSLTCVMVDLDNLKPLNDQLGHVAGDAAIEAVAEVIRRELRETDFAARYGGDEFVILLPHTSAGEARVLAERVQVRLRDAGPEVEGRPVPLTASFGIAALDETPDDDPAGTLVRRADAALYAAKRAGRARVVSHPTADDQPAAP